MTRDQKHTLAAILRAINAYDRELADAPRTVALSPLADAASDLRDLVVAMYWPVGLAPARRVPST